MDKTKIYDISFYDFEPYEYQDESHDYLSGPDMPDEEFKKLCDGIMKEQLNRLVDSMPDHEVDGDCVSEELIEELEKHGFKQIKIPEYQPAEYEPKGKLKQKIKWHNSRNEISRRLYSSSSVEKEFEKILKSTKSDRKRQQYQKQFEELERSGRIAEIREVVRKCNERKRELAKIADIRVEEDWNET